MRRITTMIAVILALMEWPITAQSQATWERIGTITAANGAQYAVALSSDINSRTIKPAGYIEARIVQVDANGSLYNPKIVWFDCRGHYMVALPPSYGGWEIAPSYSIMGRASQLACEQGKLRPE